MIDPFVNQTVLLLPFDTDFNDRSTRQNSVAKIGDASISTSISKYGGGSLYLDGDNGYLDVPASPYFDLGTGDFTFEFWYRSTVPVTQVPSRRIIAHPLSTNQANTFQIWHSSLQDYGGEDAVALGDYYGNSYVVSTQVAVSDSQWHHFAFTRSGGVSYCFLDGVLKQTAVDTNVYSRGSQEGFRIGARGDLAPTSFLNGHLDDVRLTRGVARYTEGFTPPKALLPSTKIGGTISLPGGKLAVGANIRIYDSESGKLAATATTNELGKYTAYVNPGEYYITVHLDGWANIITNKYITVTS